MYIFILVIETVNLVIGIIMRTFIITIIIIVFYTIDMHNEQDD